MLDDGGWRGSIHVVDTPRMSGRLEQDVVFTSLPFVRFVRMVVRRHATHPFGCRSFVDSRPSCVVCWVKQGSHAPHPPGESSAGRDALSVRPTDAIGATRQREGGRSAFGWRGPTRNGASGSPQRKGDPNGHATTKRYGFVRTIRMPPLPSPRKRTQPRHVGGHWRKGDVDPGRFGSIGRPEQGRSDPTAWEARGAQGQRLVGTQLNQPKARIGLGSRPRAPLRRTSAGSNAWFEAEEETGPCTQARETTMVRRHPRLGNQRTCRLNVHVRQRTIRIDVPSIHIPSKRKTTHSSQVSHHALT